MLDVWLLGQRVGTLERIGPGRMRFAYLLPRSPNAAPSGTLSLSLRVQTQPFTPSQSRPFFEGLLPEGDARRRIADQLGLRPSDVHGLLGAIGRECAGAVAVLPQDASPKVVSLEPKYLSEIDIAERIDELGESPLGVELGGTRLSLAGVQPKLLLAHDPSGRWAKPTGTSPSTHILKPPQRTATGEARFPDLVANELFCLRVAAQAGIPAARAASELFGGRAALVVERFDRSISPDGIATRVHQEDVCQALGRLPDQKYEDEPGGVRLAEVFGLVERFASAPATQRLRLFDQVVANFVLGNADAHAKNIGILFLDPILGTIAPMYDVVCTAAYPKQLAPRMALSLGGAREFSDVGPETVAELAAEVGMNPLQAAGRAAEVGQRLTQAAAALSSAAAASGHGRPIFDEIVAVTKRHASQLRRH